MTPEQRYQQACAFHEAGLQRVRDRSFPEGQKFPPETYTPAEIEETFSRFHMAITNAASPKHELAARTLDTPQSDQYFYGSGTDVRDTPPQRLRFKT